MKHRILFLLDRTPERPVLEVLLDALAEANRLWYLEQWKARRDPPASAREAGVRWRPDRPDVQAVFEDAPTVFSQGVASCGPIAAITVGHARARDQLDGFSIEAAQVQSRVVLRSQMPGVWHALAQLGTTMVDPTKGMKR